MGAILTNLQQIFTNSGYAQIFFAEGGWTATQSCLVIACVLIYLAIVHAV